MNSILIRTLNKSEIIWTIAQNATTAITCIIQLQGVSGTQVHLTRMLQPMAHSCHYRFLVLHCCRIMTSCGPLGPWNRRANTGSVPHYIFHRSRHNTHLSFFACGPALLFCHSLVGTWSVLQVRKVVAKSVVLTFPKSSVSIDANCCRKAAL